MDYSADQNNSGRYSKLLKTLMKNSCLQPDNTKYNIIMPGAFKILI